MTAGYVVMVFVDEPFASQRVVDLRRLERLARYVLEAEGAAPCELSIAVLDDDSVRRMNRDFAGEDEVTDVLSFSQREGEAFVSVPGAVAPLGEVIISYPQAERQAGPGQAGAARPSTSSGRSVDSVQREIERLLVHGVLHLLGYDHAEAEEARAMGQREEELVGEG